MSIPSYRSDLLAKHEVRERQKHPATANKEIGVEFLKVGDVFISDRSIYQVVSKAEIDYVNIERSVILLLVRHVGLGSSYITELIFTPNDLVCIPVAKYDNT